MRPLRFRQRPRYRGRSPPQARFPAVDSVPLIAHFLGSEGTSRGRYAMSAVNTHAMGWAAGSVYLRVDRDGDGDENDAVPGTKQ